ncbi:hypothetical protein OG496_55250 [Streptomyces sp. NBC_00988]|nr:hypothetical protein OG496_00035 [Streptomyces sp. NBC_00988]WSX17749.1 hypothetical protein OG496_55250 [Streptomyces sp. NBC_00988]
MTSKQNKTPARTLRRLAQSALFGMVRGASAAAGTALFAAGAWWWGNH